MAVHHRGLAVPRIAVVGLAKGTGWSLRPCWSLLSACPGQTTSRVRPASSTAILWKSTAPDLGFGASTRRRAASFAGATTVRGTGGKRSRRLHRPEADKLHPDQPGPIRANSGDLFDRRGRSWECWSGTAGLAAVFQGQVRRGSASRRASREWIWKGSYVVPWLYRVCIRASRTRAVVRMTRARVRTNRTLESGTGECYQLPSPALIGAPKAAPILAGSPMSN